MKNNIKKVIEKNMSVKEFNTSSLVAIYKKLFIGQYFVQKQIKITSKFF
jgi:hypothetical protein